MKTTSFTRAVVLFCLVAIMASGEVTVDANTPKRNLQPLKKDAKDPVDVKKRVVKNTVKKADKKAHKKKQKAKRHLRPKDGANSVV